MTTDGSTSFSASNVGSDLVVNRRSLLTALVLLLGWTVPSGMVRAQDDGQALIYAEPGSGRVVVELSTLMNDRALSEAIHQGLPLRIHVDAELWRDRLFDSEAGSAEWRATIVYDPVTLLYEVELFGRPAARFENLAGVREHLQASFDLDLRPREAGRYYYLAVVEMETLSLSDLEELRRWLRGDLADAAGETSSDGAVGRGVRRLFVRALGLPTRRVRLRTPAFDFPNDPP